ncbi:MAG: hypothetical protein HC923_10715 [Myxococcales bacterium]|nr:hypothetical protein [Myxococcales bacterium]
MGPPAHAPEDTVDRLARWLAAVGPGHHGDRHERSMRRTVLPSVEDAATRLMRLNPRLKHDVALGLATSFTEPHPRGGLAWRFDPLHRTPSAKPFRLDEASAVWKSVRAPVLSLWGKQGFWAPEIEERHVRLPDVVVGWVEGVGHNIHHERPDVVADAIRHMQAGLRGLPPGVESSAPF